MQRAPLAVEITGRPAELVTALDLTAPDGICSSAGGLHARAAFPLLRSYLSNVTLHIGRTHARAVIPQMLELIAGGKLHPEAVTTQVAPIDDAVRALSQHNRAGAIKTILTA